MSRRSARALADARRGDPPRSSAPSDAQRGLRRLCTRPAGTTRGGIIYVDPELKPAPPSAPSCF